MIMTEAMKTDVLKPFECQTDCELEDLQQLTPQAQEGGELPQKAQLQTIQKDECKSGRGAAPVLAETKPLLNRLLVSQLGASVPNWLSNTELVGDAVELYQKFEPADAAEVVLAALTVGLFNANMDGLDRAARPGLKPEVRQMELKLTHNGTAQIVGVLKLLQAHRGSGTQVVSVGSVNVGSGGKAIVGNIAAPRNEEDNQG